ncbi:NADP-dependent 3-hydroxy acid dehydrogenase YdfG [Mesorhizobium albiziae]|uniref:NADP-dependent 3-hydroxy acid dehydrogenase YdfG n=1 Tax=Neomesorhizobium albiziae TaxID=335020 RepID=A0A1I3WYZ7_9HYPH|nr:SDR family NAD(P)-dependent oxidoreductase [Mesorhizobium albiziae]GLS31927.1 short-chain dehydrogenase [Mesorhizobium albiziae]SFK11691.1 NADP-dependent 3-hydroxy acid dehydrogenase YdfG [Mesorhizobium albiziae]
MAKAFEGRHVAVTGGTGALGAAVVVLLLDEGATCHVPVNHGSAPANFAHAGHERVRIAGNVDLTDAEAVDAFYSGIPQLWASIHIAGGFAMAPIDQTQADDFSAMMDINAKTVFLCSRAAARAMLAAQNGGRIVNVAARAALEPRKGAGMVAYAASKAAVAAMTVALAEELKAADILVNAVAPSTLDTAVNRAAMPKADFSKWVSLEAAAEAIVHLASPINLVTSGVVASIYGRA